MRTLRAQRKCAEWLAYCLLIGWDKGTLDALENLWWEHHDDYGNMKEAKP